MMRRLFLLAAAAAAAVSVLAGTSQAKTIRKCVPNGPQGIETVGHVTLSVYCGTANATVKIAGKPYSFTKGVCYRNAGSMSVGVGKFTLTPGASPLYRALYLTAPATQDGTYRLGVLTLQFKGKTLNSAHVTVVVKDKRLRGTFSGKFVRDGRTFTGSFTCK
jgi:hypothetical protein